MLERYGVNDINRWICGATASVGSASSRIKHDITGQKPGFLRYAAMAELADAYGSGPYFSNEVEVQVLLAASTLSRGNGSDSF